MVLKVSVEHLGFGGKEMCLDCAPSRYEGGVAACGGGLVASKVIGSELFLGSKEDFGEVVSSLACGIAWTRRYLSSWVSLDKE